MACHAQPVAYLMPSFYSSQDRITWSLEQCVWTLDSGLWGSGLWFSDELSGFSSQSLMRDPLATPVRCQIALFVTRSAVPLEHQKWLQCTPHHLAWAVEHAGRTITLHRHYLVRRSRLFEETKRRDLESMDCNSELIAHRWQFFSQRGWALSLHS